MTNLPIEPSPVGKKPYVAPFLYKRMKGKSEAEILEASENLHAYLRILYLAWVEEQRVKEKE